VLAEIDGAEARETAGLTQSDADTIIAEAAGVYFGGCRERLAPFIDETFSMRGTIALHRSAVGLDVLRAPANAVLSIPQFGLNLAAAGARALDRKRTADWLSGRNLLLETAVMREVRWRIVTDLLCLPIKDGSRESRSDALADAILAHPRVASLLGEAAAVVGTRGADPTFRAKLEATLAGYTATRVAASDIATALIALGTGAVALQKVTPGAFAFGPLLATAIAQQAAIASFPLGAAAGGAWYGVFPATASPLLVAGSTAGLIGVAAIASAFAGILSDPVQRWSGLHERRLLALIDSLKRDFLAKDGGGFVAYDLVVREERPALMWPGCVAWGAFA
jgi:hypothetical protein